MTCWRRLRDWTRAGAWPALHELLLAELRATGELGLDRCAVDGSTSASSEDGTTSAPLRSTAAAPGLRPRELFADGFDHDSHRRHLCAGGITPRIARRGVAHGSGLGRSRWVVERGFAWLHASGTVVRSSRSASGCQ